MRTEGRAHMRSGLSGPRSGLRGGWAAARAVDVFGGCGGGAALGGERAEGGGLNPEVGRRWSERARSGAQAGSQRGSPASPVMDLWGVCPGDPGVGRGAGWPRASAVSARAGPAEALVLASVSLGSTPRLLPCAPAGAVSRRVALADGRSLSLKRCARPAPGSTFLERLWISRPPRPYCHPPSVPDPRR